MINLVEVKKKLFDKRNELLKRIASVEQDFRSGRSTDSEDQAAEVENEDVLIGLQHEAQEELINVDKALSRLSSGHYGVCSSCGSKINPARLDALPYVVECINCAK